MLKGFLFYFSYVPVIQEEYYRLVKAMKIRSFRPRTDIRTYRAYAYLIGMLLVRSFDRSKRILAAMKCCGFKGQFCILHHYGMKKLDYSLCQKFCPIGGSLTPSFRRTPKSSLFNMFWTPAFAGVTGGEQVITFGNGYIFWHSQA